MTGRYQGFKIASVGVLLLLVIGVSVKPAKGGEKIPNSVRFTHIKGAEYVGSDSCAACQDKQAKEFKLSTHSRISIPGHKVEAQGCEMCHGPASLHVDKGGGTDNI